MFPSKDLFWEEQWVKHYQNTKVDCALLCKYAAIIIPFLEDWVLIDLVLNDQLQYILSYKTGSKM